jgi:competence ComEA-like helix-hairpin-helix protein
LDAGGSPGAPVAWRATARRKPETQNLNEQEGVIRMNMKHALFLAVVAWIGASALSVSAAQSSKAEAQKVATASSTPSKPGSQAELRVDVNHADAAELAKLPGIGAQVAKRIVAYRTDNGPFEKTEELMNVRGIGEKTYLKLRPFLVLGSDKDARKK